MPRLPARLMGVVGAVAPLVVERSWRRAQVLRIGALPAPGRPHGDGRAADHRPFARVPLREPPPRARPRGLVSADRPHGACRGVSSTPSRRAVPWSWPPATPSSAAGGAASGPEASIATPCARRTPTSSRRAGGGSVEPHGSPAPSLGPRSRVCMRRPSGSHGARTVWRPPRREGVAVARCTVERLMRAMGLRGAVRGRAVKTTVQDPALPCPPDRVRRQFRAPAPNRLWASAFDPRRHMAGLRPHSLRHRRLRPPDRGPAGRPQRHGGLRRGRARAGDPPAPAREGHGTRRALGSRVVRAWPSGTT